MIKKEEIGVALNLGDCSGALLDLKAVEWIEQIMSAGLAEELSSAPIEFGFPNLVDGSLFYNLKVALAPLSLMSKKVVLAQARYVDLSVSYYLGFIDSPKFFHEPIKERVLDTVNLYKSKTIFIDVAFLSSSHQLAACPSKNGLTVVFPELKSVNETDPFQSTSGVPKL